MLKPVTVWTQKSKYLHDMSLSKQCSYMIFRVVENPKPLYSADVILTEEMMRLTIEFIWAFLDL